MAPMDTRIVHLSINRDWRAVYDFARRPENMARWASGLGEGLTADGTAWLADGGPLGQVRVNFAEPNALGVIDHMVHMPSGLRVHNAFRIVPNGDGAEAMFMVTRLPGQSPEQFEEDARHVEADLQRLKEILEAGAATGV
jgi:hypothetical protein